MHLIYSKYRDISEQDIVIDNVYTMRKPSEIEIEAARIEFGNEVIETVQEIIKMTDPETTFCVFSDLDMELHVAATEELYFDTGS